MSWTNLLHWSAQVLLLAAAAGCTLWLARVRDARLRLWALQLTLLACLLLPLLMPRRPSIVVRFDGALAPGIAGRGTPSKAVSIRGVWAAGALLASLRLSIALMRARKLRRNSRAFAARGGVEIRLAADVASPVTFGWLRPVILLPPRAAEAPAEIREPMIAHELAHIRRRDWLFVVAEEIVRAAAWFHPAVWWLLAQIRASREQLIDLEVAAAAGPGAYAESLLAAAHWRAAAKEVQPFPSVAMCGTGGALERRLRRILNPKETTMTRLHRAAAASALALSTLGMVAVSTAAFPLFAQEDVKPRVLKRKNPDYPLEAKEAKVEGMVALSVQIGPDGMVGGVTLLKGHPLLATAAMDCVKGWEFEPARKNGAAVESKATIEINFTLKKD